MKSVITKTTVGVVVLSAGTAGIGWVVSHPPVAAAIGVGITLGIGLLFANIIGEVLFSMYEEYKAYRRQK